MKKLFTLVTGLFLFTNILAQRSGLVINNYTSYDLHTALYAGPDNTPCYPSVSVGLMGNQTNPSQVIVPANSNDQYGNQLFYESYNDSFNPSFNGLYPITSYTFTSFQGVTSNNAISSNSGLLNINGQVSVNTNWRYAKFQMYYAGTNATVSGGNPFSYFNGTLGDGTHCSAGYSYISTPFGDGETFTISSGSRIYTYYQFY